MVIYILLFLGSRKGSATTSKTAGEHSDMYSMVSEQHARKLQVVQQQLAISTRNILRLFSINPAAVSAVRAESGVLSTQERELLGVQHDCFWQPLRGGAFLNLCYRPSKPNVLVTYSN